MKSSQIQKIVVIVATFNRPASTLACLQSVYTSTLPHKVSIKIVVVDASTNDDTEGLTVSNFPGVTFIRVPSDYFWARSMRTGWESVQDKDYDFVMWLNDDVVLAPDAINSLLATSASLPMNCVAVGATRGLLNSGVSYGGKPFGPRFAPLNGSRLEPKAYPQEIGVFDGNVVLIPRALDLRNGGFPSDYIHQFADTAYAIRAKKKKISVRLAPGYAGTCEINTSANLWQDVRYPFHTRLKHLMSCKGREPREWLRFCKEIGGAVGALYFLSPYVKFALVSIFQSIRAFGLARQFPRRPID